MKQLHILSALLIVLVCSQLAAGDNERPNAFFSTSQPTLGMEEVGFVWIHQPQSSKVFGSKAEATMEDALAKLEEKAKGMGADKVMGMTIIHVNLGDAGLVFYGTAVKASKKSGE
jgi:hypothetical protein